MSEVTKSSSLTADSWSFTKKYDNDDEDSDKNGDNDYDDNDNVWYSLY